MCKSIILLLLSILLYILLLLAIVLLLLIIIIILAILLVLDDRLVDDRVCDGWRGSERGERDSGELWVLMTCPLTRDGPSIFRAQAVKPLSVVAPPMQLVDCDSPLPWIVSHMSDCHLDCLTHVTSVTWIV